MFRAPVGGMVAEFFYLYMACLWKMPNDARRSLSVEKFIELLRVIEAQIILSIGEIVNSNLTASYVKVLSQDCTR